MNDTPLTLLPTTDPAALLRYRDRQYAADLIGVALLHFDLFSWLHQHEVATNEEIAAHFGLAERPLDVLLTLCRANDFIHSDECGRQRLTPTAREYLVQGSPWYMGAYYQPLKTSPIYQGFIKVLTTGKPANWQAQDEAKDWHESMLDREFAQNFTALMNCRGKIFGQYLAQALSEILGERRHLLDVAGGSGIYAATMLARHPSLRATVLEQSPVDVICRAEVASHGLSERITVQSGDMFTDPWPAADIILLSNVLHDWDWPEMRFLLEKAMACLPLGGLLIIHDAFINDDKTGPLAVAEYSALLMSITQGKCYSPREYAAVLEPCGGKVGAYQNTIGDRGFLYAIKC